MRKIEEDPNRSTKAARRNACPHRAILQKHQMKADTDSLADAVKSVSLVSAFDFMIVRSQGSVMHYFFGFK
ncbi:hypothetical protein PMHK_30160 [Pseudomonas sp. MHK4]